MSDVFVSYKAEDRRRVKPLVEALEADGYSVWWDEQIGGGAVWRHAIEAELNAAKCVIVAWSKRSVGPEGEFVQDEATRAKQRHVYVPVTIDKVHLPLGFGETQALPLTGWKGDRSDPRYRMVLAAVRRIAGEHAQRPAANTITHAGVSRRTVVGGGAVAAAAIVGVGAWALLKPHSAAAADSIAVLPFANLSGDPSQAYFSDGIAEELRSVLARITSLKVIGRTSCELVRDLDAIAAAQKLGVTNVVTGSVRRSPSLIRVSAELISGRDGGQLWSQAYDRGPGDILAIQSDIAKNVAGALSLQLGQVEPAAIGGTENPAAHDLYLKAVSVREAGNNKANFEQAIELFQSAIALDPNFADAYAQKAQTISDLTGVFSRSAAQFDRGYEEAAANARKAIALAPRRARGHAALAAALAGKLDLKGASSAYRAAFQRFAGEVEVLTSASYFLSETGDSRLALEAADRAIVIDPLNPRPYAMRGSALLASRRYADALVAFQKAVAIARSPSPLGHTSLGLCLMMLGKAQEAREAFAQAPPDNVYRLTGEAMLDARLGDRAGAARKLEQLRSKYGDSAAYQQAEVLAQMGQRDQAFSALAKALEVRDPGLVSLKSDIFLDPLRSDARFAALEEKLGFPDSF